MVRIKVLIVYNKCWSYRIPIFNLLAAKCDLTVAYSLGAAPPDNVEFDHLHLPIKQIGPFTFHKSSVRKLATGFDVVIAYGELGWLNLTGLGFGPRSFALVFWSIGLKASYKHRLGDESRWDKVCFFVAKRAEVLIIYSTAPVRVYENEGWDTRKIFVAHNTTKVINNTPDYEGRDGLLFIGTIYREKGIDQLMQSYLEVYSRNLPNMPKLRIVGGGEGLEYVKEFVCDNGLSGVVEVLGPIYEEARLREVFGKTIACLSPAQAGLSVLKSMGYGVPFITHHHAITGGEIYNIEDGVNGVLYTAQEQLTEIIYDVAKKTDKYFAMGKEAKNFYDRERTPEIMANALFDACEYACAKFGEKYNFGSAR